MKKIILSIAITTSLVACNTTQNNTPNIKDTVATQLPKAKDTAIGIEGADKAVLVANNTYSYCFGNVVIFPDTANAGESINAGGYEIKNNAANSFAGAYKKFVIVDNGTGPNKREVLVYDIAHKMEVFKSVYEGDLKIENDKLHFISIATKVENAKAAIDSFAAENKCTTKGCTTLAGYAAYFDFTTLKTTTTKDIKCFCEQ
jgi:hypothetical protein